MFHAYTTKKTGGYSGLGLSVVLEICVRIAAKPRADRLRRLGAGRRRGYVGGAAAAAFRRRFFMSSRTANSSAGKPKAIGSAR